MKKTILVLIAVIFAISGAFAQTETEKIFYTNGELYGKGPVTILTLITYAGIKTGEWTFYYKTGEKYAEGEYYNNSRYSVCSGEWIFYWKDGTIADKYTFDEYGRYLKGELINTAYENKFIYSTDGTYGQGSKTMSWPFKSLRNKKYDINKDGIGNFVRTGYWKEYTKDGKRTAEGYYDSNTNKATSYWILYYKSGKMKSQTFYSKGKKHGGSENYYESGKKESHGNYLMNKKNGLWSYFNKDGSLKSEGDYFKGKAKGEWKYYYSNGIIKAQGLYVNGKKDGNWKYYYENEDLKAQYFYANGELSKNLDLILPDGTQILKNGNGAYKTYYSNGKLSFSSMIKNGHRYGIAKWYYNNGQLKEEIEYKYSPVITNGLRWNNISCFDENGIIRKGGSLKNGNGTMIGYNSKGKISKIKYCKNGVVLNKDNNKFRLRKGYYALSEKADYYEEYEAEYGYQYYIHLVSNGVTYTNDLENHTGDGIAVLISFLSKKKLAKNNSYSFSDNDDSELDIDILHPSDIFWTVEEIVTVNIKKNNICEIIIKSEDGSDIIGYFYGKYIIRKIKD